MHRRTALSVAFIAAAAAMTLAVAGAAIWWASPQRAEGSPPGQSSQTRTVEWFYWLDISQRVIQRSRLDGSGVAQTVVTSTDLTATARDVAVDENNEYVYWADDGHNEIRRRRADGTGSVETLVSSDITQPYGIALDYQYVYWADRSLNTIKRVRQDGTGNVETLADSTDGVNSPWALVISRNSSHLYWHNNGDRTIRQVATTGTYDVTTLATGVTVSGWNALTVSGDGEKVYWGESRAVKSVLTTGVHTIATLATNTTETPVSTPLAVAVSHDGTYVYWADSGNNMVRRVLADGTGGFETVASSNLSLPTDLVVSADDANVYWADNGYNQVLRAAAAAGTNSDAVATGLSNPTRLVAQSSTETVAGSCITEGGTLAADYASYDWTASIDGDCPSAFYAFTLTDDTDLRFTAQSRVIDPVPLLRSGGIGGTLETFAAASGGASTPFIYHAQAGRYALEVVRGASSSQTSGELRGTLQTQPMLDSCLVNLGALTLDGIALFGGHDEDCGDRRDYFFHLEYRADVSASITAVGFTPRMSLRQASASDTATAIGVVSANPGDLYEPVTTGAYRLTVERIAADSTYNVSLQAFGLPQPTRTLIPTPTPRFQPNQDVRLDPDPRGIRYQPNKVYRFRLEGAAGYFPVTVRATNAAAVKVSAGDSDTLDCEGEAEIEGANPLDVIFVHICAASFNATLQVVNETDRALLAQYTIFVAGAGPVAPAGTVPGPDEGQDEDHIGVGIFVSALCEAMNLKCDVGLARNGVGVLGSLGMFACAAQVARGRVNPFLVGIGVALFLIGLVLANSLMGVPLYWAGIGLISIFLVAFVGFVVKFRKLKT